MSLSGTLMLYTTRRPVDPAQAIKDIISMAQPWGRLGFAERNVEEDCRFEQAVAELAGDYERSDALSPVRESLGGSVPTSQAHTLWIDDRLLLISLEGARQEQQIWNGMRGRIPESVRGEFLCGSMSIAMGWHDIVHVDERSHPAVVHRVARAYASISFFGYGLAKDFDECRRQMSALPEVQQVKAELESILGPLEIWLDWSW